MNERLFTFAVIFHPTADERKKGERSKLLVPPGEYKLYPNESAVQATALRHEAITDEHIQNADRLEVAARPF